MKLSKVKRKLQAGMEDITSQFEDVIEHHSEKIKQPVPSSTLFLGRIPHFIVLAFTVYIIWIVRPGSSKSYTCVHYMDCYTWQ